MNTIPNKAPSIKAFTISKDELMDLITYNNVETDDYIWIEIKVWHGRSIDSPYEIKLYHWRIEDITNDSITFDIPNYPIIYSFDDYGNEWRVWNMMPTEKDRSNAKW